MEKTMEAFHTLDLSQIESKIIHQYGWLKKEVIAVRDLYKNFLWLQKKYGHEYTLVPSQEIDDFWHLHILDTEKYRQDCQQLFGRYLDHQPSYPRQTNIQDHNLEQLFAKTQALYAQEFNGAQIYQVRGLFARIKAFFRRMFVK